MSVSLVLTAWVLVVIALGAFLSGWLGMIGSLLAVAGGLVVLALLVVWITSARNRRTAELRATTRALWTATAVNAVGTILRGEPHGQDGEAGQSAPHRSALLIAGGFALMLLAFLLPGTKGAGPDAPGPKDEA